jgi:hypothetical protein
MAGGVLRRDQSAGRGRVRHATCHRVHASAGRSRRLLARRSYLGVARSHSIRRRMVSSVCFFVIKHNNCIVIKLTLSSRNSNPPTDPGRVPLSPRFLRHAPLLLVDFPSRNSLMQIYGTFNRALLKLVPPLRGHADALTEAMVDVYGASQRRFTPDLHAHYIYSPRELTRWVWLSLFCLCIISCVSIGFCLCVGSCIAFCNRAVGWRLRVRNHHSPLA